MPNPTVFIALANGIIAADVVRAGLARRLLDADRSVRVVFFSPLVRDPEFIREFSGPRVTFHDLPPHTPKGLEARLMALIQAGYLTSDVTDSVRIRRAETAARKTARWLRTKRLIARALAPSLLRKETRYDLIDRLVAHREVEQLFDEHQPALVVVATPGLMMAEVPLLRTARRRGVRTVAVYASWDNFTNKLLPVRRVDRLIVWNDIMTRQAIELHGYRPDEIRVVGVPQFDWYFRGSPLSSRETFFRRIGADPARKLVTVTTSPRQLYSYFERVIRILAQANEAGRWPFPAQVLVRVHPRDEIDRYAEFERRPHVIVEKPFRKTVAAGDGMAVDAMPEHKQHLADTMAHSDVVVSVASTIAIEASIFDTPIVNVSFDGETPSPFEQSARRYYQFTHFANVMRHSPGPVAATPDELVAHVAEAIVEPTRHTAGRRRVVVEQCQFLDGKSTERVGDCLVADLAEICGLRAEAAAVSR